MDTKGTDFQSMMASLMQNAQKMQENMRQAYQESAQKHQDTVVVGKAGGDLVTAHVNLKMMLTQLELTPALFEETPAVIAELITAAVNQGLHLAQQAMKQEMKAIGQKAGLPMENPFVDI